MSKGGLVWIGFTTHKKGCFYVNFWVFLWYLSPSTLSTGWDNRSIACLCVFLAFEFLFLSLVLTGLLEWNLSEQYLIPSLLLFLVYGLWNISLPLPLGTNLLGVKEGGWGALEVLNLNLMEPWLWGITLSSQSQKSSQYQTLTSSRRTPQTNLSQTHSQCIWGEGGCGRLCWIWSSAAVSGGWGSSPSLLDFWGLLIHPPSPSNIDHVHHQ